MSGKSHKAWFVGKVIAQGQIYEGFVSYKHTLSGGSLVFLYKKNDQYYVRTQSSLKSTNTVNISPAEYHMLIVAIHHVTLPEPEAFKEASRGLENIGTADNAFKVFLHQIGIKEQELFSTATIQASLDTLLKQVKREGERSFSTTEADLDADAKYQGENKIQLLASAYVELLMTERPEEVLKIVRQLIMTNLNEQVHMGFWYLRILIDKGLVHASDLTDFIHQAQVALHKNSKDELLINDPCELIRGAAASVLIALANKRQHACHW